MLCISGAIHYRLEEHIGVWGIWRHSMQPIDFTERGQCSSFLFLKVYVYYQVTE